MRNLSINDLKNLNIDDVKEQLNKHRLLIVCIFVALCILFADYKFILKSMIARLKVTTPQVGEVYRKLTGAQRTMANMTGYKKRIEELQNKLSPYNKRFSTKQQISSLLEGLSLMANSSGVKIIAVKPHTAVTQTKQEISDSTYQKFPISIKATCGYHQLGTFLNKLENADTFMRISDIKIEGDSKSPMEHRVNILVNTYVLTEGT